MVQRNYAHDTSTEPGTDGALVRDLATTADTGTLQSETVNDTAFVESQRWQRTVGAGVLADGSDTWDAQIDVSSFSGTVEGRFRLQRINSSGTVQSSSSYSAAYTTTGVKTLSTTWDPGTWAAGDRLALSLEIRRAGGHGNVSQVSTLATTYIDAPQASGPQTITQTALLDPGTLYAPQLNLAIGPVALLSPGQVFAPTTEIYVTPPFLGTGSGLIPGHALLDGTDDELVALDADRFDFTSDLTLIALLEPDDPTPAALEHIISKWVATGNQRSYRWHFRTDGTLRLEWSTDGISGGNVATSSVAPTFGSGPLWLMVTLDADDGASGREVKFWYSNDPASTAVEAVSWTQLGTTQTGTNTSVFAGTADLCIGSRSPGGLEPFAGKIYGAWGYDPLGSPDLTLLTNDTSNAGTSSYVTADIAVRPKTLLLAAVDSEFSTTVPTQPTASALASAWLLPCFATRTLSLMPRRVCT